MAEILLLVCFKEPVRDPVIELMNTGLQTHKRNFKFPAAVHEYFFKELAKVGRNNEETGQKILKFALFRRK
jgi:hypothetical protein